MIRLRLLQKERRKLRVSKKIKGVNNRPRISIFRSNRYIYAQLIDDKLGKTIVSVSEKEFLDKELPKLTRLEKARHIGKILAEKAMKKKISKVVFDKSYYKYHGQVKALADGAREVGLIF